VAEWTDAEQPLRDDCAETVRQIGPLTAVRRIRC
jgi:hypothetical protein